MGFCRHQRHRLGATVSTASPLMLRSLIKTLRLFLRSPAHAGGLHRPGQDSQDQAIACPSPSSHDHRPSARDHSVSPREYVFASYLVIEFSRNLLLDLMTTGRTTRLESAIASRRVIFALTQ